MKLEISSERMFSFALAMLMAYSVLLIPADAWAQGTGANPIGDVLCKVVEWFNGPIGGGIATLAIIVVGVGALMGKVSWGMAIIVGLGVGIIFGAGTIVELLGGKQCGSANGIPPIG